jgi:uncharacterized protein YjlB
MAPIGDSNASQQDMLARGLRVVRPFHHLLLDDGIFPNNSRLPLIAYREVLNLPQSDPASVIESLFTANHWPNAWRNGIFGYHHYHSTAHEALGVFSGTAQVQLGGESGLTLEITRGDVLIIPAGVAHKNMGASRDFRLVGAYPQGQRPDTRYGEPGERPQADHNIAAVPVPARAPLYGADGALLKLWKGRNS